MNDKYCYSTDGFHFYGEYETEQEAIEAAKREKTDADRAYVGRRGHHALCGGKIIELRRKEDKQ